jgi:hypothetical protein
VTLKVRVVQDVEALFELRIAGRVAVAENERIDVDLAPDVLHLGGAGDALFEHPPLARVVEIRRRGADRFQDAAVQGVVAIGGVLRPAGYGDEAVPGVVGAFRASLKAQGLF